MFYPDNAPQWLGTCDVCGQSPLVAPPPLLVLDDLLLLLNEPTAEVPALCPACAALVSPAADFVRRCRRASRRLRDSLSTDLKEEGWSAGEDSDDDEKPLLHLKRDPSGDEQECVEKKPVKLCKRAKKEKKKKKRVKKEKDDHLEAAQTSPPTSEPREAKVRPARAKREKGVKLEPREEVGADGRKVVKEGRRVVETEEYVVIRLTKEQVREEMAERARGERYLSAPHRCTDCVKGFNYEDVLLAHMERHSEKAGEHQCELCHQYCPSVVSLRGHIKSHTTRYSCKQCGAVRLSRQHLLEHAALAHARAARRYACARCPFTTPKRTMFQKHVRTHAPAAPVACDKCGKMFKTIETLRAHMLMLHSGRPPLRCAECPARFVRSPALRAHVAAHAASRHYCVECDVTFRTRGALAAHLRRTRAHRAAAAPRVTCEVCHKSFGMPAARASHAAWAHEARREHACAACGRRYGSRGGLRAHRRAAHARGERAHACGYCAKAFATRAVLAKHLRTHTGERPYECGECGRSFAQAGTRATHVRLVHRRLPRRAHQGPADQATRQADTFQPPPAELASAAGL